MNITGMNQCPSCNNILYTQHAQINFIVCNSCLAYLEISKGKINIKPNIEFYKSYQEIIIGAKGKIDNKSFKVIGNKRVWLKESVYNYYNIVFSDGALSTLKVGYGSYQLLNEKKVANLNANLIASKKINNEVNIDGKTFDVNDKDYYERWELDGEIYVPFQANKIYINSLKNDSNDCYEIHFNDYDFICYSIVECNYKNLFDTEPSINKHNDITINCEKCSTKNIVTTWPYAQSFSCTHCNANYELERNGGYSFNKKTDEQLAYDLELQTILSIKEIDYEVVGMITKQEFNSYSSRWKEYTLYNKINGFAFLSGYNGHWIFIKETTNTPNINNTNEDNFINDNIEFNVYNKYSFKVIHSKGAFPYFISKAQETRCVEYISPPDMWILEKDAFNKSTWFKGEHISKKQLEKQLNFSLPYRVGVGAVEPRGYIPQKKLITITAIAVLIILLIHVIFSSFQNDKLLFETNYYFNDSTNIVNTTTDKFVLDKWRSNLSFELSAPVSNTWLDVDITLVNTTTGKEYTVEKGVEYYFGYSDGESWTEGSTNETVYLHSIPAGTYFLTFQATRDYLKSIDNFSVAVRNDVPRIRNLFVILALVLIWPVLKGLIDKQIEKSRWSNSDFSPFE